MRTFKLFLNLATLCLFKHLLEAKIRVLKYVYEKDMSEHCRRRVMPSVFISNNVVDANSQILHFSQLEVPYSCFISIRTEISLNIILVIHTDINPPGCFKDGAIESPVKVFSMGETFGGYWGPLPDSLLSTDKQEVVKFYTLRTSQARASSVTAVQVNNEDDTSDLPKLKIDKHKLKLSNEDDQDYIRQLIPIANITSRLVESDNEPPRAFAADDTFHLFYDSQRKPGEKYNSTVVPLIQFSAGEFLKEEATGRGSEGHVASTPRQGGGDNHFDFEYDLGGFTLDPRLILPLSGDKHDVLGKKYRPNVNKRLDFKKNKNKFFSAQRAFTEQIQKEDDLKDIDLLSILANLTENSSEQIEKQNASENEKYSALLQRLADWQHNYSAYLAPNLTLKDPLFLEITKENIYERNMINKENLSTTNTKNAARKETSTLDYKPTEISRMIKISASSRVFSTERTADYSFTDISTRVTSNTKKKSQITTITFQKVVNISPGNTEMGPGVTEKVLTTQTNTNSNVQATTLSNVLKSQKASMKGSTIKPVVQKIDPVTTGTMADHASWDNVVQVAPKIAGMLLITKDPDESTRNIQLASRRQKRRHRLRRPRRRRSIQAIPIEAARPHNLTSDPYVPTTPGPMYRFVDMQDFAQLVELQDDEMHGRVALRYMRRYVGATMFDLCAAENRSQHVLLFNTSRILLVLNNFTLPRMKIIVTPARWLPFSDERCNEKSLECQVAGKRCCVNKLVACDGVPNCGCEGIYDEDRLWCGADSNIHQNVYLAAFTFLAALLTMLYVVYYWLKRCVPKVSEAFFIYTDGTENTLYLDSIMRSPIEDGDGKLNYQGLPYRDSVFMDVNKQKETSFLKKVFTFSWRKKKKIDDFELEDMDVGVGSRTQKTFSFAEMEINQLTKPQGVEIAVQTGDSLEIRQPDKISVELRPRSPLWLMRHESIDPRAAFQDIRVNYDHEDEDHQRRASEDSELNILKFLREAKQALYNDDGRERELKNTMYDRTANSSDLTATSLKEEESIKDLLEIIPVETNVIEQPFAVPGPSALPTGGHRHIRFSANTRHADQKEEEDIKDNQQAADLDSTSLASGRDFRRFWGSKTKKEKSKQKKVKQLRMHSNK